MNVLLLNDTSDYHNGCKVVTDVISKKYGVTETFKTHEMNSSSKEILSYAKYDHVILNGEGTMHDNGRTSRLFLSQLHNAYYDGCDISIINTVWQNCTSKFDYLLPRCKNVTVREIHSYNEMKSKHNFIPKIMPDCSYFYDVPYTHYQHVQIYEGQYWLGKESEYDNYPSINIFKQSWEEIVNRLRNADLLITGRHHEMYAACKAKCKFLVKPGNTWKNEGLLDTVGANIPWDIEGILSGKYDGEYEKIWSYLDARACSW